MKEQSNKPTCPAETEKATPEADAGRSLMTVEEIREYLQKPHVDLPAKAQAVRDTQAFPALLRWSYYAMVHAQHLNGEGYISEETPAVANLDYEGGRCGKVWEYITRWIIDRPLDYVFDENMLRYVATFVLIPYQKKQGMELGTDEHIKELSKIKDLFPALLKELRQLFPVITADLGEPGALHSVSGGKSPGEKRKRGRPSGTDHKKDKQIYDAWNTGQYKTKNELAKELGMTPDDVKRAIDRARKRLKKDKDATE